MVAAISKEEEMPGFFKRDAHTDAAHFILPALEQIKAWKKANRKMKWGITAKDFATIEPPPILSPKDQADGFSGLVLSYGFGDDGRGNADAVISGRLAWEYAHKKRRGRTWQCRYVEFGKPDYVRLRPSAPARPKGFYYVKFRPGDIFLSLNVAKFRKSLDGDTGCGPEGIQLLSVTHSHVAELMNRREIAFTAFADYDVAPYGFSDFFDAVQMFCSNNTLGLGIGNIDQNYPLFGIPTLRFT
jgi:hypothetical protein